jgi:hypothetical protein
MRRFWLGVSFAVTTGVLAGCNSGPALAPVSGVVTLNGKPYSNAVVSFQPVASGTGENINPGKGSSGTTDANGRFILRYNGNREGAIVGKHMVRITTMPGKGSSEPTDDTGTPDGVVMPKGASNLEFDPIPMEWNEKSQKVFEVTAAGTDQANFDIVSVSRKKK